MKTAFMIVMMTVSAIMCLPFIIAAILVGWCGESGLIPTGTFQGGAYD